MPGHSSTKSVPTFLQPNTVRSSRAAIFDDDFEHSRHRHSGRTTGHSQHEESEDDEDHDESRLILERLYGQLQGAIEIQDSDMTTRSTNDDTMTDQQIESAVAGEQQQDEGDGQVEAMEFRLFASQDTPTVIVLDQKEVEIIHVHRERPDLDESAGSERMRQITEAAIDAATVLEQAKVPWPRTFFAHKVIHVPRKQIVPPKTAKKSKRKREWEKKTQVGLIDQATIDSTARKVKVSESWGQPFVVRKGLDRNTIDAGTSTARENDEGSTSTSVTTKKRRTEDGDTMSSRSEKKLGPVSVSTIAASPSTGSALALEPAGGTTAAKIATPPPKSFTKLAKAALPPKKPKASKQVSKLDNIMAILTGK
ncbi:hypothetical protein BGZ98_006832 [Dissophora globulifera]|nr:hypothetical protein BGZ98_006832 [Dissophora globulifera]